MADNNMQCPLIFLVNVYTLKIGPANPSLSKYALSLVAIAHNPA
jgi:hypothetical protein